MTSDRIILEREGALAVVTLNDPERLNAVDKEMLDELGAVMNAVLGADGVRAVVITGAGRAFCSGANLAAFSGVQSGGAMPDVAGMLRDRVNPLLMRMKEARKPIIAAVNGAAAGVGCGLALAADIVLMARSGYFFQSFTRVGLVPDGGSSWLVPRLAGSGRAMAMLMLGDRIGALDAVAWGLAHRWYEDGELVPAARELAKGLANGPTLAYAGLKKMLAASPHNSFAEQLELEAVCQQRVLDTADCREGIAAFVEKRPAHFSGA